jgi:hypothetical protein
MAAQPLEVDMKHVTFADKSLLVGDAAADALLRYAAALSGAGAADAVDVNAISSDGDAVVATFLLNAGSPLMAETTTSSLPEPDNDDVVRYMHERIDRITQPSEVPAHDQDSGDDFEDEFGY